MWEGGIKNGPKNSDVFYGRPLINHTENNKQIKIIPMIKEKRPLVFPVVGKKMAVTHTGFSGIRLIPTDADTHYPIFSKNQNSTKQLDLFY